MVNLLVYMVMGTTAGMGAISPMAAGDQQGGRQGSRLPQAQYHVTGSVTIRCQLWAAGNQSESISRVVSPVY